MLNEENYNLNDNNTDSQYESDSVFKEISDENSIFLIIKKIYEDCLEESLYYKNNGDHDNMQYCPMIA